MDAAFLAAVESLKPSFLRLRDCAPYDGKGRLPLKGVYLFSEEGRALYVGRSNNIAQRYRLHCGPSSDHNGASFAMLIARAVTGRARTYRRGEGRAALMKDDMFRAEFDCAKERIREMEFRAVEETDQIRQALLEVYCAVVLHTPFNKFETH